MPAICVAAIVTLIHQKTSWLDPVDALVFTDISNSASYQKLLAEKSPEDEQRLLQERRATVISIDTDSYSADYGERVPLSRCKLLDHLAAIYKRQPALLVIDLDLSPAKWLQNAAHANNGVGCSMQTQASTMNAACESQCETQLYDLIKRGRPTKTVLLLPFGPEDLAEGRQSERHKNWIASMNCAGVDIGEPWIRESMGIILRVDPAADSLARRACLRMKEVQGWFCEKEGADKHGTRIDPRKYLNNIHSLTISEFSQQPEKFADRVRGAAVFFGAGWQDEDVYLSPVGKVYGVEVQAASFLTLSEPLSEKHVLHFFGDVLIALFFGIVIAFCWRRYFHARFSSDAGQRIKAIRYVALLVFASFLLLWLAWGMSKVLLAKGGIWASPIPLVIGMLIEGFLTGMAKGAVHASDELTKVQASAVEGLGDTLKRLYRDVPDYWNKVDDPETERTRIGNQIRKLNDELRTLGNNSRARNRKRYRMVAVWVAVYRIGLGLLVAWCLWDLFIFYD